MTFRTSFLRSFMMQLQSKRRGLVHDSCDSVHSWRPQSFVLTYRRMGTAVCCGSHTQISPVGGCFQSICLLSVRIQNVCPVCGVADESSQLHCLLVWVVWVLCGAFLCYQAYLDDQLDPKFGISRDQGKECPTLS